MPGLKKEKVLLIILILMSFCMFFYKLGAPSLFETDEVIYSQIAREIVRSGDWLTLHLFSKNWFIHPPFYMWLTAAASYIFGDNEANTRVPCALFAVGLVYITYLLGKKMFRDGVGLMAGFILATSMHYIVQSRIAIFDIPLVFFMTLSVLFFFYWLEDRRSRYYYLFFLSIGLAVLMKGPVGMVLPLISVFIFLAFTRDLRALFNYRLIPGLVIAFLIGGTWYTAEALLYGRQFIDSVFGFYMIGRYLTSIEQHCGPWFFYFPVITLGFMPWTSFLPFSIAYQWRNRGDSDNLFIMVWLAVVFLFFSAAGTKLPGYIMSLYPFAAISVSKMVQDFLSGEDSGLESLQSNSFKTLAVFSVILVIAGALLKVFEFPDIYGKIITNVNASLLIIGAGGLIASLFYFREKYSIRPVIILVATMFIFSTYTAANTMITLDDFKPMKAISLKINEQYTGGETIIGYNVFNKGSFRHYIDKPIIWTSDIFVLRELIKKSQGKIFLITNEDDFRSLGLEYNRKLFTVYKAGEMVLLSNQK